MQKHNEEFNKSLAEYLEKRLTLKEHTEPEVEHKPSREIAPITPAMKVIDFFDFVNLFEEVTC